MNCGRNCSQADSAVSDKNYCAIGQLYAERVIAGEIPACELVKLACQRQINDLQRLDWEFTFDENRANHVCWFIENLPHIKGRWKSKNIELEPWQCFLLTTIFGWIDSEQFRRYRKVYCEVPRKNSKSTLAAAVALYMLCVEIAAAPDHFKRFIALHIHFHSSC